MSKRLYSIISNVMDIPISEINDESSPESIESWDSFNSYVLLDELETEFKTEFSIDEVVETKNVADIKKYLKKNAYKTFTQNIKILKNSSYKGVPQFRDQISAFVDAVTGGTKNIVSAIDGCNTVAVCCAAIESLKTSKPTKVHNY